MNSVEKDEPPVILDAMDFIASIVFDNSAIKSTLPFIRKEKPNQELESKNLCTGSFHIVSLFQENYSNEGFAIEEQVLDSRDICNREEACKNCNEENHPEYEKLEDFSWNIMYAHYYKTLACRRCSGLGFQGEDFIGSLQG